MSFVKQYIHPHPHKIFSHPTPITKKNTPPSPPTKNNASFSPTHPYPLKIMFIRAIILGGWRLVEKYFAWLEVGGGGWVLVFRGGCTFW